MCFSFKFLREVIDDESLRQFVGSDGVEQIELVHAMKRLLHRDWIEQVAQHNLNRFGRRRFLLANQDANIRFAFLKFFHYF
jgi:hypothetical protein